jgi:hypothetical protein
MKVTLHARSPTRPPQALIGYTSCTPRLRRPSREAGSSMGAKPTSNRSPSNFRSCGTSETWFRWGPCRGCNIIQCNLPRAGGLPAARRRTSTARASCDKKRYAGRLCPEGQRDGAAVLLDEARRMRATTSAILPTVVMMRSPSLRGHPGRRWFGRPRRILPAVAACRGYENSRSSSGPTPGPSCALPRSK